MKSFKVGLQLFSISGDMQADMDKALYEVKNAGYDCVEFAGYFGKSAKEVKALLDKYELECPSVHQNIDLFLEQGQSAVDFIKTLGVKYCGVPHYAKDKLAGTSLWSETVKRFTDIGRLMRENGIQLIYHNHDFEFEKYGDKYLHDYIFEEVPDDLIIPELDVAWVTYGGEDPVKYIVKYSGKVPVLHLKDFSAKFFKGGPVYSLIDKDGNEMKSDKNADNEFKFEALGNGVVKLPEIVDVASKCGTEYLIVERDISHDMTPLESARVSREYLRSLGI